MFSNQKTPSTTRVLYITRARLSFSRAHTQNILKTAERLGKEGNTVIVFSCTPEPKDMKIIMREKDLEESFALDVASSRRSLLWRIISLRGNFDILYYRDPFIFYAAFLARFLLRKKVVFEVHGNREWKYGSPFWRLSLITAHGAVFITRVLAEYYRYKKPFVVVHTSGVDLDQFSEQGVPFDEVRKTLSIHPNEHLIVYVGSFLWYSMETLIGMMKFVQTPSVLLVVGAKETEIQELKKLAKKYEVAPRVRYISRVRPVEVPRYLKAADVLVNPLVIEYEGSISSKLYEYLAAGKPIVSSEGGANQEILLDGKNALLVSLSGESFAKAVEKVLQDNNLREMLSANARLSARLYTWEERGRVINGLINKIYVS